LQTIRESLPQTHAAKKCSGYVNNAITLHDSLNGSPNSILQLIAAQLFAGKHDDAVQSFSQFVRMDLSMMAVKVDARRHLLWATEVAQDSGGGATRLYRGRWTLPIWPNIAAHGRLAIPRTEWWWTAVSTTSPTQAGTRLTSTASRS
jgi:hypothetical protein